MNKATLVRQRQLEKLLRTSRKVQRNERHEEGAEGGRNRDEGHKEDAR